MKRKDLNKLSRLSEDENSYKLSVATTTKEEIIWKELQINLAVILLDTNNKRHFYTIKKRDGMPDFHDREGFINSML